MAEEKTKLGFGKTTSISVGSLIAGVASGIYYIQAKLTENLSHALMVSGKSNMEAGMHHIHHIVEDDASKAGKLFKKMLETLPTSEEYKGSAHWKAMRTDLKNEKTVFGKALNKARSTPQGERALTKIEVAREANADFFDFMHSYPEAIRKDNPHLTEQFEKLYQSHDLSATLTLEGRQTLVEETVRHIPWRNKISLSGIHLTGGQKITAGVIFSAITAISVGALYKAFSSVDKGEQQQR